MPLVVTVLHSGQFLSNQNLVAHSKQLYAYREHLSVYVARLVNRPDFMKRVVENISKTAIADLTLANGKGDFFH